MPAALLHGFLSSATRGSWSIGSLGFVMTVGGLESKVPAEARAVARDQALGTTDPKLQDEMLKLAKQIYK